MLYKQINSIYVNINKRNNINKDQSLSNTFPYLVVTLWLNSRFLAYFLDANY